MVTLQEYREYMRTQAEIDRNRKSIQITAQTVEAGLKEASVELGLPIKRLEFEVLEKGSRGLLGFAKKDFILIIYEAEQQEETEAAEDELGIDFDLAGTSESEPVDRDGEVIVRLTGDGALLKVTPPIGRGKDADPQTAIEKLRRRGVIENDRSMIEKVVENAESEFIRVGDFSYNPANDSTIAVDVGDSEMKAYVIIQPPGSGGIDQSYETIISFLKTYEVIHGIDEELIRDLEDHPRYNESVLIAEGTSASKGADAKIIYNFESDLSKVKLKEKNGRVDFREMNLVQNVVEGQILAKKVPPEEGKPGRTVTGKKLPSEPGKDTEIGIGKNVELSEDGELVRATINGQVIVVGDKINVEPIYVVQGDVNLKTGGNVIFLGTVLVKGSVDDSFTVKASGNIEVMGNVGKAKLDSEGEIIVHQGITGKGGGNVRAGKSVWAKFIENAAVEAAEFVVASEGIINSTVLANKKIVCHGKRATVVGGTLKAAEEINAKTLRSVAGSETLLEVGYDPKSKEKLASIEDVIQGIDQELEEINLNIQTLLNLKKMKKELPEDKEAYLKELEEKKKELIQDKNLRLEEVAKIQEYLSSLKIHGKIGASARVFPGVRVSIKDAFLEVRNEFNSVTFVNEANVVKVTKYEELEEDLVRRK